MYPEHSLYAFTVSRLSTAEHRTAQRSLILPITGSIGLQVDLDMGEAVLNCQIENTAKAKQQPKNIRLDKNTQGDDLQTQENN